MTTIQTRAHGSGIAPAASATATTTTSSSGGATPAGMAEPTAATDPSALLASATLLEDSSGGSSASAVPGDEVEPTSKSNGAPYLPDASMSADDMAAYLSVLNSQSASAQANSLQTQLQTKNRQQLDEIDRSNAIIAKNIEAAKQAAARRKTHGILGWVKKAVTIVAAVVAVAALTFISGPAAPLVAAVAIGCLLNALMSMASDISVAAGGPQLPGSMSAALQLGMVALLTEMTHDEKLANSLGTMLAGLAGCFSGGVLVDPGFAGQLVGGAAMLGGTGDQTAAMVMAYTTIAAAVVTAVLLFAVGGGSAAADRVDTATKVIKATRAISGITQAGVGAYDTQVKFEIDSLVARQMRYQADNKEVSALMSRLQSQVDACHDELKRVIDQLSANNQVISGILSGAYEQMSRTVANLGGRATV